VKRKKTARLLAVENAKSGKRRSNWYRVRGYKVVLKQTDAQREETHLRLGGGLRGLRESKKVLSAWRNAKRDEWQKLHGCIGQTVHLLRRKDKKMSCQKGSTKPCVIRSKMKGRSDYTGSRGKSDVRNIRRKK